MCSTDKTSITKRRKNFRIRIAMRADKCDERVKFSNIRRSFILLAFTAGPFYVAAGISPSDAALDSIIQRVVLSEKHDAVFTSKYGSFFHQEVFFSKKHRLYRPRPIAFRDNYYYFHFSILIFRNNTNRNKNKIKNKPYAVGNKMAFRSSIRERIGSKSRLAIPFSRLSKFHQISCFFVD